MENKNLIFIHSHLWRHYWRELLLKLQAEHGCQVTVLSTSDELHHYRHLRAAGGTQVIIPDLRKGMAFEDSEAGIRSLEDIVLECEMKTGRSARRALLTAERTIGAGFSQGFYDWPDNTLRNHFLKDSVRPRMGLLRCFAFVNELFDQTRPDLVLSRSFGELFGLTTWFLAQRADIPVLACRFSKMAGKRTFWTTDYHHYNTAGDARYQEKMAQGAAPSQESLDRVAKFRERPEVIDYIKKNWAKAASVDWKKSLHTLWQLSRDARHWRRDGRQGPPPQPVLPKFWETLSVAYKKKRDAGYYSTFEPNDLKSLRYVYFPCHKEPEMMLNFETPACHDQRHTIKLLSSMIPAGYHLLVKEHRANLGRRSRAFLNYVRCLPGVTVIHPLDDQFKYINNADLVVTETGSSGWEGLLLKRPVVTLDYTLYDVMGLNRKAYAYTDLDKVVLEALKDPQPWTDEEYDRRLALRMDAEIETSMPEEEMFSDVQFGLDTLDAYLDRISS